MLISRTWLQTFFDAPLPGAAHIADALTFHSSEIEEVVEKGGDVVFEVKVLPDKSAWMLSHRGVAKELATILELPMAHDPLAQSPDLSAGTNRLAVSIDTKKCARYAAAVVTGVSVGPSPQWLKTRLEAIGQRSVNNVVDATNYVMFHLGQPLHAFDAGKLEMVEAGWRIGVRAARNDESITTLTGESYTLTTDDLCIVDAVSDTPIGIAGVKGGKSAMVDQQTTDLIIESANFDRVSVRKTAQRHKLRTDASARYENGVVPELAGYGLEAAAAFIAEIAGGTIEGYVDVFPQPRTVVPVSVSVEKINSVLGLTLSEEMVLATLRRFDYEMTCAAGVVTVVPPFERDDLLIPEDLIEEVGRMYGLTHVPTEMLSPQPLSEYNKRFFYAEAVRDVLISLGFSEVYTSSFNKRDEVKLANALASDKGYLRSTLRDHIAEALTRNVLHKDLLGLSQVAIFEIGTVFMNSGEHLALSFGVRTGQVYKAKVDDPRMEDAVAALTDILGSEDFAVREGVAEINLDATIDDLPEPTAYASYERTEDATYTPFSLYPFVSRDIALWVSEAVTADTVEHLLRECGGELLVRVTLFDEFRKEGRTSYAFRLVFQSRERTLTDEEVGVIMERVAGAVSERGWEVR